jgi:plastocyanin
MQGWFGSLKVVLAFLVSTTLLAGAAVAAYAQAQTFSITERNFAIEGAPASVRAGQQLRFNVTNPGPAGSHNLAIDGMGVNIMGEEPNVQPGTSGVLTLTAPTTPGTYNLYCPVGQHRANGMDVRLTVVAGAAALSASGGYGGLPLLPLGLGGVGLLFGAAGLFLRRRTA